MDLEFHSTAARGLRRYVRLVTAALGPTVDCAAVHWGDPVHAYVALSGLLHWFPGRAVALTWDAEQGWAMVLPSRAAQAQLVLRYLGNDILPAPRDVATFSGRLFRDEFAGQADPPRLGGATQARDLAARLACYAGPRHGRRRGAGAVHLCGVITSGFGHA
jgi:uncharacterized protein DUF6292